MLVKRLCLGFVLLSLIGCAAIRRHPAMTGMIAGSAVGITVGLVTRPGHCASVYDGKPYNGTPPCPK